MTMKIKIKTKQRIPWAMAAGRALLGPVLIAGEKCGWNGLTLAWIVVTALVSDIFDGMLARRWKCNTAGVRLFDSMADTFFYASAAIALWIGHPQVWREHALLLTALLILETVRFGVDFAKFGKPASYHSYLAKLWGLTLAAAVVSVFASEMAGPLLSAALSLGIVCNLEGLAMSAALPIWRQDVKTLRTAWLLRHEMSESVGRRQNKGWRRFISSPGGFAKKATALTALAFCLATTETALAAEPGHAAYWGGTIGVVTDTSGSLDTSSATVLRFLYKKPDGTAGQIGMDYANISGIEPTQQTRHPLGILPLIAVSLVAHQPERYLVTIRYTDTDGAIQIAEFEVSHRDQQLIVAVVNARAPRNCGIRNYPCPAPPMQKR